MNKPTEICEHCHKEEATILRLQTKNGKKKQINLCDVCADPSGIILVDIEERIEGYFRVTINGLSIAHYKNWNKANQLVMHFIEINPDKKIIRKDLEESQ